MAIAMRRIPIALSALALGWSVLAWFVLAPVHADPPADRTVRYAILRNGGQIGTHETTFTHQGERFTVHHDIEIRVSVLFVDAYHYTMDSRETWEGDRLLGLAVRTDKNGDPLQVFARASSSAIRVRGTSGQHQAPADAVPDSLHFNVFDQPRTNMIRAEDGRVVHVSVSAPHPETIEVGGRRIPTRRYEVRGATDLSLWYDESGLMVKKRLTAPDGSEILTVLQ